MKTLATTPIALLATTAASTPSAGQEAWETFQLKRLLLLALSVLFAFNVYAREPTPDESIEILYDIRTDLFQLGTRCQPIDLVVEYLSQDAAAIGLAQRSIETLVRSRLRAARIYDESVPTPYLYVNVNVSGLAFNISVQFKKLLCDTDSTPSIPICRIATTWDMGGTGTHGQNSQYILQVIPGYIDRFIDEYLRVNADHCQ